MSIKVFLRDGIYYARGTAGPPDRRQRVYKSTGTGERARAEAYAAELERTIWDTAVFGKRAIVTYAEAAAGYLAKRKPGIRDARAVGRLVQHFGAKRLAEVMADGGQAQLDDAIAALCPDRSPGTQLRAVVIPHTAILNHAARRGWCGSPNFERPDPGDGRTDWLLPEEAAKLIHHAAAHLKPLLTFLIGTGARVGEAMALTWADVDLIAGTAGFRNVQGEKRTKSRKDRIAKLSPAAVVALSNLPHREGPVFLTQAGRPYAAKVSGEGGGQFKTAWRSACLEAGITKTVKVPGEKEPRIVPRLPPHATRHTWATWFQAATKDPMRLRDEGGWSTVSLVERYAHRMKQEDVPSITLVWGVAHPDLFPAEKRANGVFSEAPKTATL